MKHRIGLTVTDPNHPMVSKRKETIQKTVRVSGDDREKAINSAIAHYKRKGYKVHDHHYIGTVNEVSDKTLTNYLTKVHDDSLKHDKDPTKRSAAKRNKSVAGFSRAFNKLDSRKPDGSMKEGYGEDDVSSHGGTVIYKKGAQHHISTVAHKTGRHVKTMSGHEVPYHHIVSTDASDWKHFRDKHSGLKEEVEQVDEISRKLTHDYFKKAYAQKYKNEPTKPTKLQMKNRDKGMGRATNRLMQRLELPKGIDPSEGGKYTRDSVEYSNDAVIEAETFPIGRDGGNIMKTARSRSNSAESKAKNFNQQGSNRSKAQAMKDFKEDIEQVDELSKKTLGNYVKGATDDVSYHSFTAGTLKASDPKRLEHDKKAMKRQAGVEKAVDKMTEALGTVKNMKAATKFNQSNIAAMDRNEKARKAAQAKKNQAEDVCPKCHHNPCQCDVKEAWNMSNGRDPQRSIKVGHKVRSYDFPGMHDDHYVEGHVVGETPHTYHIRVNKVVRAGKEVPTPAHMSHVEAPKGRGMFSNAYGVHKIIDKQQSVQAAPEAPKGGAKTFDSVRKKK